MAQGVANRKAASQMPMSINLETNFVGRALGNRAIEKYLYQYDRDLL